MTLSDYHRYYDILYSSKQYVKESSVVLRIAKNILGRTPHTVFDVGCGTGTHSIAFAKKGLAVVGTDIDCAMITLAKKKIQDFPQKQRPTFLCAEVTSVRKKNFDLAVSLFHVINYIDTEEYLLKFFTAIHRRVNKRGVFIFDCWNGLAVLLDPPRVKRSTLQVGDETITVTTVPKKCDAMDQRMTMMNHVRVQQRGYPTKDFHFTYTATLWTPWHLQNVLTMAGFTVRTVSAWMRPHVRADQKTWKIMFLCQKIQ